MSILSVPNLKNAAFARGCYFVAKNKDYRHRDSYILGYFDGISSLLRLTHRVGPLGPLQPPVRAGEGVRRVVPRGWSVLHSLLAGEPNPPAVRHAAIGQRQGHYGSFLAAPSRLGEAASARGGAGAEGDHPSRHLPPASRGEHRGGNSLETLVEERRRWAPAHR